MTKPTLLEPTAQEQDAALIAAAVASAEATTAAKPESELVAFLRDELKTAQHDAVVSAAAAKEATAKLAGQAALFAEFEAVVRTSVDHMSVALGGTANSAAFSGDALAAEHKRLAAAYAEKFKVGGVAATAPADSDKPQGKPTANPLFAVLARSVPASK